MNAIASAHNPPASRRRGKLKLSLAADAGLSPADEEPVVSTIVPSAPQIFPLRQLRRAAENVRHTRVDEDVAGLADDIAAHGLLQSLIGYREDMGLIQVVGGGRRFQALRELENRGLIDGAFPVPVLIREVEESIELSLAENLQQRTMSPVDEFFAFKALMENPANSPTILAKRFGFSERVVKQRLRLADLATPVLDALAGKDITLDAAMAYASSQDQALQQEVFKVQSKRGWEPHRPHDIRHALQLKGFRTDNPLFKFVGAESYERRGGTYDDDLFNEPGKERLLATPFTLETAAREMIDFQMLRLLPELQRRSDLSPSIVGYVVASDLRLRSWGNGEKVPVPTGFVKVEKYDETKLWKTIRNNRIEAHVLVGIDEKGELAVWSRMAFVPKNQKTAVDPPAPDHSYKPETDEERVKRFRREDIERLARRLAVGPFGGTPFEGRAFWPDRYDDRPRAVEQDGVTGYLVTVQIFASDAAIAEQRAAAEQQYDQELREREEAEAARRAADQEAQAASEARRAELEALDPPAVVVVDGQAWARAEDGSYTVIYDEDDGGFVQSWLAILANFDPDDIGDIFATREAFDAAMTAAQPEGVA